MRLVIFAAALIALPLLARAEWTGDARLCAEIDGDHELALTHCTAAIESGQLDNAELGVTYRNRSYENMSLDRLDDAFDDASRAIELEPRDAAAWSNRANVRLRQDDHDGAVSDYHSALEAAETHGDTPEVTVGLGAVFDANFGLAWVHAVRGERDLGLPYATAAFDKSPDQANAQAVYNWYGLR